MQGIQNDEVHTATRQLLSARKYTVSYRMVSKDLGFGKAECCAADEVTIGYKASCDIVQSLSIVYSQREVWSTCEL